MHKACGWMLREVGKRDVKTLLIFLDSNAAQMPRTMLRYALEKLSEKTRKAYLNMKP
jgi:3-methyladenine DNA glycosylase AlkD